MNAPWEQHGNRYYLRAGDREYMVSWDSLTGQWAQYCRYLGDCGWSTRGYAASAQEAQELQ